MMEVIKNGRKLIKFIYSFRYPASEKYGIRNQIRRAAVSINLNITEGNSRNSTKEYLRFCYIAKGSLAEVIECLEISSDLGFIDRTNKDYVIQEYCEIVGKQLNSLINYLKSNI